MAQKNKPQYVVKGSIESAEVLAHVILDKKNNSIHVHLYGSKFDDQQKPILVKQADSKFPECEDVELVRQVVEGELRSYELQIREIKVLKEDKILVEQFAHPHRIIVRFK